MFFRKVIAIISVLSFSGLREHMHMAAILGRLRITLGRKYVIGGFKFLKSGNPKHERLRKLVTNAQKSVINNQWANITDAEA